MSSTAKVAIVTGAASGIGEALSRDLVKQGWNVAGFDLQEAAGNALAAELGEHFSFVQCDIADYDAQAAAFASVWKKWGRLDALLANAGIVDKSSIYILHHRGKTDELPPKPDTSCTDIDYKAVMYGTQLAIHFMRQNEIPGGRIVCTASIVGVHPGAAFPEYCGAKAAVITFAKAAAPILKLKDNITINVVCPGIVATAVIPQAMRDSFGAAHITPVSNIVKAYNTFLSDPSRNGQVMECSIDKQFLLAEPDYPDERTKRTCTVYDPYFVYIHGEPSGIEGAIQ